MRIEWRPICHSDNLLTIRDKREIEAPQLSLIDAIERFAMNLSERGCCFVYSHCGRTRNPENGEVVDAGILFTVGASADGDSFYHIVQSFYALGHGRIRWQESYMREHLKLSDMLNTLDRKHD